MKAYFPTWDSCGSYEVMVTEGMDFNKFREEMAKYNTDFLRKNIVYDSCAGERGVNDMSRDELLEIAFQKCCADIMDGDEKLERCVNLSKRYNVFKLDSFGNTEFMGHFKHKIDALSHIAEVAKSFHPLVKNVTPVIYYRFEIFRGKRVKYDEEGNPIYKQPCYVSGKYIDN